MSSSANAVTLITGQSGSGKTSLLATAALWLYRKQKKVTRLYTADGGGFGTSTQALIQAGIIQVFRMRTRAVGLVGEGLIEETCMRVSQGWWPKDIDQETGNVAAGVEMVPPVQQVYKVSCPSGHEAKKSVVRPNLQVPITCPTCKTTVTPMNAKVEVETEVTPGFEQVGAVCIEGLTSMSDWILMSLADRVGRNELGGEKPALGGNITSGSMVLGSNNRAHFGFAQGQAEKWLLHSISIPNLVLPPIWTGLETRVDGDGNIALPFYGPAIAGQARTGKVPQWVGNYLGAQVVQGDKGPEWRLYLTEYRGEDGVPHRYKTRAEPGTLPPYLCDEEGKGAFSGFNLGLFFELMEKAKEESLNRILAEFPEVKKVEAVEQKATGTVAPFKPPQAGPGLPPPRIPQAGKQQ